MEKSGFVSNICKKVKRLFKEKLFLISLACYLLIPIAAIFVIKVKLPFRTTGTYECYESGVLTGRITLGNHHYVYIENLSEISKNDAEFKRGNSEGISWSYRSSDWYKEEQFNKPEFQHISKEYILFKHVSNSYYFTVFFFVDGKLYSEYLLDESRGGGQKCYTKV